MENRKETVANRNKSMEKKTKALPSPQRRRIILQYGLNLYPDTENLISFCSLLKHIFIQLLQLSPKFDRDFLRTLSALKSKDPSIYDKNVNFFNEKHSDTG